MSVLIVGGGLAGLFAALKLAPRPVLVLAGAPLGEGASSAWAQGGVAAAVEEGDAPEAHAADTVAAGAGTVDAAVALGVAREAPAAVRDLLALGVPFDRDLAGRLAASREAAHSARRVVRVKGDAAGRAIMEALIAAVRATPCVTVVEGVTVERLLVRDGAGGRRVVGALARDAAGRARAFPAAATVLATGGVGHLYALTTNPPQARGLGLAAGALAGALVADAEFVQFHPTALDVGLDPAPLATEALRGEGAVLVDREGRRFMVGRHPDAELAPRDVVARAVFAEVRAGRGAFLDARAAVGAAFPERFPTVAAACRAAGIDPVTSPVPVAPAEHYHMGGLWTDARGRTTLAGLWAIGEVASTGLHGANRLASNSLLEAVVMAARAAADVGAAVGDAPEAEDEPGGQGDGDAADAAPPGADAALLARLRRAMTDDVGVLRDAAGLARALAAIAAVEAGAAKETTRGAARAALLIAAAALARRESRGGHHRTDHPAPDPAQARRSRLTLADARAIAVAARDAG